MQNKARVVRIMTNTAAMIQKGCSVYSRGKYATDGNFKNFVSQVIWTRFFNKQYFFVEDAVFVANLLESIGSSEGEVKEDLMDVVTALAGSGPAYVIITIFH